MDNDRIVDLGEDVRNYIFEMLDSEPDMTGDEAGRIARAVEEAFLQACQQ